VIVSNLQPLVVISGLFYTNKQKRSKEMGALIFFSIYLLPTFIVLMNSKHPNKIGIILLDVLLGWTIIGWIIALISSFNTSKQVTVKNNRI
jgi:hypothetical protein